MLDENEGLDPESNPIQSEDEEITDSELNGTDSTPIQGDPTLNCPVCNWESKKGTSRSMKSHIRHYVEVEGDEAHIAGKDEAYALIDDWRDNQKTAGKPTKKKPARGAQSSSTHVRVEGIKTSHTPAEEEDIARRRKRIDAKLLLEKEQQIDERLGITDQQEQSQRAFYDEEQRKEDILKSKDREISELHKRMEREKDRAHEKEVTQIKAEGGLNLKFQAIEHNFMLEMEKLKTDTARNLGDFKGEMDRAKIRGVNTFFDLLVEDYRHKKRSREGEIEKLKNIELVEDGDAGILSLINPKYVRKK